MLSATEALAALAKIQRQKKIVAASLISETMKQRMTAELDAELAKIEKQYTGEPLTQTPAKTPAK